MNSLGSLNFEEIRVVGVVGSGQMGTGIAQIFAQAGYQVVLMDINPNGLTKSLANIEKSLTKLAEKGKITEPVSQILPRIRTSGTHSDLSVCQLVIEAASETESVKKEIFKSLGQILDPRAVIATNTSSLPITRLATYSGRPTQFIGMHFMNPVPIMALVEVITGHQTSPSTKQLILSLNQKLGKETILSQDYPGFVVNRILMPMINEAFFALMEGVASAKDIDQGMKLGTNQPMGPLALADFIGLDTCLSILNVLHEGLGDSKYRACPLLKKYVAAGELGRKTGKGVYDYSATSPSH